MNTDPKHLKDIIKNVSTMLSSFPNEGEADENCSQLDSFKQTLKDYKGLLKSGIASEHSSLTCKFRTFLLNSISVLLKKCKEGLISEHDFSFKIDCGEYLYELVEFLSVHISRKGCLESLFIMLPNLSASLFSLIIHNISHQDCFFNGNEFSNLKMMKLVLTVLQTKRDNDPSAFKEALCPVIPKIFSLLAVCCFDALNFDSLLTEQLNADQSTKGKSFYFKLIISSTFIKKAFVD